MRRWGPGSRGAGELGSRGAGGPGSRGAGEPGSRGAGGPGGRRAGELGSRRAGELGNRIAALVVAMLVSAVLSAQQKSAAPAPPPAAQAAPAKPPAPVEAPSGYAYRPDGRRDPFVSLLGRGSDTRTTAARPSGLAGVLIGEATITGIWKGASGYIATLRAPDNKTYIVKPGERLLDGTVKAITQTQVVFSQDVNDPLSLVKQREIPKSVRPGGESQ